MAILKREEVLDDWGTLISGANGKAEEAFTATRDLIAETKAPNVAVERREMAPGTIRGLFGTKRDFLVVRETGSRRLRPCQIAPLYLPNIRLFRLLPYAPLCLGASIRNRGGL